MARRKITAGITGVTVPVIAQDTTSSTGAGLAITAASSGLVCDYRRQGQAAWTTVTLSSGTVGTASGSATLGKLTPEATGPTGRLEFAPPDNAFAAGARWCVIRLYGVTNMLPIELEFELDAVDYQDAQRAGLAALPASGTLAVTPTLAATQAFNNTGQTSNLPADLQTIKTQAVTAAAGVTFPASVGTSTFAGGAVASVANLTPLPLPTGTVGASPTPTSTTFTATGSLNATAAAYAPTTKRVRFVLWTAGANAGETSSIASYAGAGAFTLDTAPTGTIAATDTFFVI